MARKPVAIKKRNVIEKKQPTPPKKKSSRPKKKPTPASHLQLSFIDGDGNYHYYNTKTDSFEVHKEPVANAKASSQEIRNRQAVAAAQAGFVSTDDMSRKYDYGLYQTSRFADAATYGMDTAPLTAQDGRAPHSEVNAWSLLKYRGTPLKPVTGFEMETAKNQYKVHQLYEKDGKPLTNPTAANLIEICDAVGDSPGYRYSYRDFLPCEHYGEIPNNHLLTLRRFPAPVEDNIIAPVKYGPDGKVYNTMQPPIAQAITWMSPKVGNDIKEILKFSVAFKWDKAESQMQTIQAQKRDTGMLGGFLDSMPMAQNIKGGANGETATQTKLRTEQGGGFDPLKDTYPNHNLGEPLNIIKEVQVRKPGLEFSQEFSLVFKYDLKGYPHTSPKLALLDVISNMLVLTYNNAPFWGGATRYTGGGKVGKPFGDLQKLQNGDVKGFLGSVVKDLKGALTGAVDDLLKGGDSKILNNVIGGGLMKLLGGPQGGQIAAAFLTGDATGQWHLTIGNPLNPIAVVGNLGCTGADFELEGPLGFEDFPSKLKVTIKLKPNRPRDKADIESMFNAGKGRLYVADGSGFDTDKTMDVNAYGHPEVSRAGKEKMIKQANG
jgi:hypothetical protein